MAVLCSVVQPPAHFSSFQVAELTHCSRIGLKAVCDDRFGSTMSLQGLLEEAQCSFLVPLLRNVALEDLAFVIYRAPKIVGLSVDLHEDLIDVPTPVAIPTHSADPLPLDVSREPWAKPVPPEPYRLVANINAAFGQQVLNVSQGEREPNIHHHHKANDFRR